MTILVENYLDFLNKDLRAAAHEWQGPNIPYGDDSNRPNLIRQCTMLEGAKLKINCLRKLRDQAAMNPFYQHRIDRYIDEITDTYEPTEKPGTIPGNEFKETGVGEDTKLETLREAAADKVMVGAGAAIGGGLAAWRVKRCKQAHPNDRKKFRKCLMQWKATWKIKPEGTNEALSAKEIAKMTKALKKKKLLLKRKKASKEKTMELMLKRYLGK